MTKAELRKKYKTLRRNLSLDDVEDFSIAIANQLIALPIWEHSFYHIFLPIEEQKEVNTEYILSILSGKDKNILVSRSDFETYEMHHFLLTDNTILKKNQYNIPEPVDGIEIDDSKIDVVFIPLLAFDKKGNRVGYGKGFYDRFLSKCKPETLKIGLSFFEAEEEISNVFANDIKLDHCITKTTFHSFK
ncbi:5-formyltetrahydrofolate cyclo-ligase [Seonamhaeicola marinus]|uniref:5-formyltetrahydrofolate cyclo-ligase n=1 Tax=Seonamhaeicola marinus TaxID=1912246 RepID=A0A5D0HLJ7_9FLAO|nr:5-formyltetrahydrofolate cyclo-ligase [Seonamhaeicola marinus]TYA70172.1 5-formyltetrahydrofolate cyclo-ligase [Seonamhaeicola marinus]